MSYPYNSISQRVNAATLPDLCDANDLSELIIGLRGETELDPGFGGHLDDCEVKRILRIAFLASCRQEEGAYPVFRLFIYSDGGQEDELRTMLTFEEPLEISVENIRKIAPALPSHEFAMRVDSVGGRLMCGAIIHISESAALSPGRPEYWIGGTRCPGLMVRVDGPGDMRVTEYGVCVRLYAGRIKELVSFTDVQGVSDWLQVSALSFKARMALNETESKLFGGDLRELISAIWSHVLAAVLSARHGGALAILPTSGSRDYIQFRHGTGSIDLGEAVREFWIASIRATQEPTGETLRKWLAAKDRLNATANQIAALANVDGCVGLTPDLSVIGFGGEIHVSDDDIAKATARWIDARTGEQRQNADHENLGGTRHRSAWRLSMVQSAAIVFVASQDGDLRVFANHRGKVSAFNHLSAWVTPEQRQ